ncbi:protein ECERIFERUM 2-like [Miscanthus floridulus]|uniref:protein ECERIFERUM 2-like n=1 Tax=Miscanthus floridulus TaxID=154761 RepID=UPI0034586FF1
MAASAPMLVHVESLQTAVPMRMAGAGKSLPIAVSGPPLTAAELQRRFRAVLYYRGAGAEVEAAARERAAWVKESLCAALVDHPEMAGRLRRRGDGNDDDDGRLWEVKLRDTGVRLVQASVEATMAEFLEARGVDRERKEAALALWTDVDVHEPDICAPLFMQLTRFLDGGYAVGVSCSLLLADPLSLFGFLKSWARKNTEMQAQSKHVAHPVIQYTHYIQSPGAAKRVKSGTSTLGTATATAAEDSTTTVLFGAPDTTSDHRALAAACVGMASKRLGGAAKEPPRFTVMARDSSKRLHVQTCGTVDVDYGDREACHGHGHGLAARVAQWSEAGLEDLALEGSKPVHVSYSISPSADEGLVVVMPAGGAELLVSVTVPNYM